MIDEVDWTDSRQISIKRLGQVLMTVVSLRNLRYTVDMQTLRLCQVRTHVHTHTRTLLHPTHTLAFTHSHT